MSNEARHRDIAALLARGVIRIKRSPLAAKAIESHMPDYKAYSAEQRPNNSVVYRIADVQERIEEAEHQLAKVNRQLLDLEKQELTTQEIEKAFIDFDRIWDALTTREKSQLLALLVSKVEFDQSDCTIAITFHASGIETLEQQSQEV